MAYSVNNLQDQLGRPPTQDEINKLTNASVSDLILYKNSQKPTTASGNVDYVDTSKPSADITGAVLPNNGVNGNVGTTNTPDQTAQDQLKAQHDQALKEYQDIQKQVADIDKTLNDSYLNKKKEIEAQGGIVNESQLRSQIANEQAPLLSHRKTLASSQSIASQNLNRVQSAYSQGLLQSQRLAQAASQFGQKQTQAKELADTKLSSQENLQKARFTQQDKTTQAVTQRALDMQNLKSQLAGTNQGVSTQLATAIENGQFDASKINSRNIKIYNDLAALGVDSVSSSLSAKERAQIVTQGTKWATAAKIATGTLEKNMPILIDLADKVKLSDVPAINAASIAGRKYTSSDPNINKYVSIIETLRSEYSTLLAKGGASSQDTRAGAVDAIPAGLSSEAYRQLADQLQVEGKNIISNAQDVVDTAKANRSTVDNTPKPTATHMKPAGTIVTDKKGKKYKVGADGQSVIPL